MELYLIKSVDGVTKHSSKKDDQRFTFILYHPWVCDVDVLFAFNYFMLSTKNIPIFQYFKFYDTTIHDEDINNKRH